MRLNSTYSPVSLVYFSAALHRVKKPCFRIEKNRVSSKRARLLDTGVPQAWDNIAVSTQSVTCLLRPFVWAFKPAEKQLSRSF
jgi:hypothetical protein